MSCKHPNPPGYLFCGHCGEALEPVHCRCGFVAVEGEMFCGRCGAALTADAAKESGGAIDVDHRFDLEYLVAQAAEENKLLASAQKARVNQDEIRNLLTSRRKKL